MGAQDISTAAKRLASLLGTDVLPVGRLTETGDDRYQGVLASVLAAYLGGVVLLHGTAAPGDSDKVVGQRAMLVRTDTNGLFFHNGVAADDWVPLNSDAVDELTQAQAEDATSTVFGIVSGERLGQAITTRITGTSLITTGITLPVNGRSTDLEDLPAGTLYTFPSPIAKDTLIRFEFTIEHGDYYGIRFTVAKQDLDYVGDIPSTETRVLPDDEPDDEDQRYPLFVFNGRNSATTGGRELHLRPQWSWIEARRNNNRDQLLIAFQANAADDAWTGLRLLTSSAYAYTIQRLSVYESE